MRKAAFSSKKNSLLEAYQGLYQWRSLNEFCDQLKSTIAYRSEDNSLIALNKPFGVGTYKTHDENSKKQNVDKVLYQLVGSPRYCLSDALDFLTEEFKSPRRYTIVKGLDRYMSGLTLITNDDRHHMDFKRAVAASRINRLPPFGFRAVTNGYPTMSSSRIYESVGLEQFEVDELGDYKEPIVTLNPGSTFKRAKKNKKIFQAELSLRKVNKELSVSLVDLFVSSFMWDFARCYISSKTAFILGDVRFSRRVREILGRRIQVSAFKSSGRYDDSYEPLGQHLRDILGVESNNQIPLMLDLNCLRLKYYNKKTKEDLIIKSEHVPLHFALTCSRLGLLDDNHNADSVPGSSQTKCD